ncbi:Phospholipase A2-like protein Y52B11A.8 [Toxocara canis]|uniref:Phospholipase A2-like protein Y52B11A.8 n=1 Tax=Toxocara canis TaxID=6265 RepID=A0A0B2VK94_TOXCA|nr:Phospholipase A2-like protein Y52B11A.8 [Toxocara canis]
MLRWLFIAQVYIVGADSTVSFDNWQCGTDQETREMAYKGAQEGCPNVMGKSDRVEQQNMSSPTGRRICADRALTVGLLVPIQQKQLNNCCIVHDECYSAQLGQSKCDDDFCECLNSAALKTAMIARHSTISTWRLTIAEQLNNCCIVHDECYSAQLGQSKCDDDFCECLNSAALKAKNVTNCKSNVELACWAVRFFGSSWYDANAYEQKKQKELNSTKQQKDMKTLAQEPTSSRTHITTKIKAITSEAANTTRVKVTETTAAMTELTPFNAPTPYKSTKPPECVCIMEDVSLQQWCTNAMDICPEYQNEMCDCHLYHTKCDQDIDSNSMLCSIEFAKCLSRSVRMREGKCYETIDAMYIEYVSKANRHPGLLGTMQNWIGGVIGIAVNASTMVANSFEGESWKKVLLMGAIIVLLSMLTYVKFFSNALNALVQWRTPLKLVPEKMRLIQIV